MHFGKLLEANVSRWSYLQAGDGLMLRWKCIVFIGQNCRLWLNIAKETIVCADVCCATSRRTLRCCCSFLLFGCRNNAWQSELWNCTIYFVSNFPPNRSARRKCGDTKTINRKALAEEPKMPRNRIATLTSCVHAEPVYSLLRQMYACDAQHVDMNTYRVQFASAAGADQNETLAKRKLICGTVNFCVLLFCNWFMFT